MKIVLIVLHVEKKKFLMFAIAFGNQMNVFQAHKKIFGLNRLKIVMMIILKKFLIMFVMKKISF